MSKYTTEVRFICENYSGYDESKGYASVDEIISAAVPKVFDFELVVFDDAYRNVLFTKILKHYYTREIGMETVGLWRLKLETKLQEIMPYYNQLYRSELLKFNPLYDTDLHTTHVGEENGQSSRQSDRSETGSSYGMESGTNDAKRTGDEVSNAQTGGNSETENTGESAGHSRSSRSGVTTGNDSKTHYDLYSDTPQGGLTGVNSETYLTNVRKITDTDANSGSTSENGEDDATTFSKDNAKNEYDENRTETRLNNQTESGSSSRTDSRMSNNQETSSGSDRFTNTESYLLHVVGKQSGPSYSQLLREFRETFLNIDMMVIEDLNELFMQLW